MGCGRYVWRERVRVARRKLQRRPCDDAVRTPPCARARTATCPNELVRARVQKRLPRPTPARTRSAFASYGIYGTLPLAMKELTALTGIYLAHNRLYGTLPPQFNLFTYAPTTARPKGRRPRAAAVAAAAA